MGVVCRHDRSNHTLVIRPMGALVSSCEPMRARAVRQLPGCARVACGAAVRGAWGACGLGFWRWLSLPM